MNQVSPKLLESARLGTALILFRGSYAGVIEPDKHYIPLEKDFSNIEGALRKTPLACLIGVFEAAHGPARLTRLIYRRLLSRFASFG
jgi:hypothetical protein